MDPVLSVAALSVVLVAVIAFVFFKSYLLKQRSEVETIAKMELHSDPKKPSKPPQPISKNSHSHSSDKDQNKRHHPLDLNTLKGHADSVTGLCFSSDGRNLATACADGVVRVYKLEDASSFREFVTIFDEDPKTLKVFPIPLHDSSDSTLHYDRLSLSPDGKILATTHGSTLQWLCMETGKVLDTAAKAHDGTSQAVDITWISWSPKTIPLGNEQVVVVLATARQESEIVGTIGLRVSANWNWLMNYYVNAHRGFRTHDHKVKSLVGLDGLLVRYER
ncbi:hypothetical protein CRYUN_Cryun01aG0241100 [Craigia yunnanensis]